MARAQGHEIHTRSASHRGQILFHEQRLHPKVVHDAATTLKGRSLWKGYCRAVELSKISLGVRQEKTLDNLSAVEQWLSSDHLAQFEALIAQPFSNHIGLQLAALLEKAIEENDRADKQARILKWKQSLRRANRDTYSFLKHKTPHAAVRLSMVEASPTADLHSRLDSISKVWRNIYNQHKNNEPTFRNCLAEFGPTMQTHVAEIPDPSQQLITDTLMRMRPSSPGLDQIAIDELQIAVSHCPQLVSALCQLFQCIEQKGKWPIPLTKGAVTFIPKENEDEFLSPDKYRPITILSSIYRLWSATRHDQLASLWFPFWRHSQCYGGKGCKSADELAFQTCKQLQQAQRNQLFAAGVSFDLAKCFDSVPITLALDIVQFRGAPPPIVNCVRSFYHHHSKYFKLDGHYMKPFKPANGLVQGCPLSMLIVSTLVGSWLEYTSEHIPSSVCRSYADDLSGVVQDRNSQTVKDGLQKICQSTKKFTQLAGLKININKTFTFGPKKFAHSVADIKEHQETFRLVGCSIKSASSSHSWTPLEKSRQAAWQQTMARIFSLPQGWVTKVHVCQSVMSKLTYGQGMHFLNASRDNLRSMRASVVRALLHEEHYSASPLALFALLAPPALDPAFALQLSAFRLIMRMHSTASERTQLKNAIHVSRSQEDGPLTRAKQLYDHPVFSSTFQAFLDSALSPSWEHDLREAYRLHTWHSLCSDRAQHFSGTWSGVDRTRTLSLLHSLTKQADLLQSQCDAGLVTNPDPSEDPRAKLKVLRQLLLAGLMTPERDARHRKIQGDVICACNNGCPTIEHISWYCALFATLRQDAIKALPVPVDELPTCFKLCTVVPNKFQISTKQVVIIQDSLIKIWQKHIQDCSENSDQTKLIKPTPQSAGEYHATQNPQGDKTDISNQRDTAQGSSDQVVPKKGHILKLTEDGGVFCQLCGKSTKYLKHQRLKILNKPCQFPNLPPDQWLQKPGALTSVVRLKQQWTELNSSFNQAKHHYIWNQKVGKDRKKTNSLGLLWCQKCGFEQAWMNRRNNPKTPCVPKTPPPSPPTWVLQIQSDDSFFQSAQSRSNAAASSAASSSQNVLTSDNMSLPLNPADNPSTYNQPRFRLHGKQSPSSSAQQFVSPMHSSSSDHPPTDIG